jgi:hypothetical protein
MPNQDRTSTGTTKGTRQPPPASGEDKSEQDQRDLSSRRQRPSTEEGVEKPDDVEIGDPVPEDDRTLTAGAGETGEDEDVPAHPGNLEGSSGERH